MTSSLQVWARSEVGRVRTLNEDSFIARRPLFLVADGLGGHAFGDVASQTALRVFDEAFPADAPATPDAVVAAVTTANADVRALSRPDDIGAAVAATTLVGLVEVVVDGETAWLAVNVGDSRLYAVDASGIDQLSVDHSAVQELYEAGIISHDEMDTHPERNIVTKALGADDAIDPDIWLIPARGEQTFLICSDGLTNELLDDEIAQILGEAHGSSADPAQSLAEAAVAAGGRDNVTVIVLMSRA